MSGFSISDQGITIQTAEEIAAEQAASVRAKTGNASLPFTADTFLGQQNEASADRIASIQQLIQGMSQRWNLSRAGGNWLSDLVQIGGELRDPATQSLIQGVTIGGIVGATAPKGMLLGVADAAPRFMTDTDVTMALAPSWATSTPYEENDVVTANGQVWFCYHAGTSASSGPGPNGTSQNVIDGSVFWWWLGTATGYARVDCHSVDMGPIGCGQFGLRVIVTPEVGITGCINDNAAQPGRYAETNEQLRLRYTESYHLPGNCTTAAIQAKLLALEGMQEAKVYENNSAFTGGGTPAIAGMPPGCVWAIVDGTETDESVGAVLVGSVAAGISRGWPTAPNVQTVIINDAQGVPQTVYFSTPDLVNVDANCVIVYGSVIPPAGVQTAIENALTLQIGQNADWWSVQRAASDAMAAAGVPASQIVDLRVTIRRGAVPYSTNNVAIAYNEKARPGTISVTST